MYCNIVFMQAPDEVGKIDEMIGAGDVEGAIGYLSEWDYGWENEYDDALADEIECCRGDDRYEGGGYTLIYRRGLYASLWRPSER